MAIIGLKDLHYAKIKSEDKKETEYGDVKELGPAISLGLEPSSNDEDLYADDAVLFSESAKGATSVELNTAYLENEVEADILGKDMDADGGITDSKDDKPPYIAIGGRAKNARGGYDYFWVFRVKLTPGEDNKQTKEDTPEYQTPTLSGKSLPRLHDGREKYKLWDENEELKDSENEKIKNWFEDVIDKDWAPKDDDSGES